MELLSVSWPRMNTVTFPRALREAIPDWEPCGGRALKLTGMTGRTHASPLRGPRVTMVLTVEETGELTGKFDVLVDMDVVSARALGERLIGLADSASPPPLPPGGVG